MTLIQVREWSIRCPSEVEPTPRAAYDRSLTNLELKRVLI